MDEKKRVGGSLLSLIGCHEEKVRLDPTESKRGK